MESSKTDQRQTDDKQPSLPPLVEGEDYYLEGGKFVFTAHYHLKRGYCCKSGCRHCPFGNKK